MNGYGSKEEIRIDQLAPHSIEAEEAVIGSVLINADALWEVSGFLQPDHFFLVRHAWIYEAMLELQRRKDPLDILTIAQELEGRGQLAECGGAAYLLSVINKTPSSLNCEGYGIIVQRMWLRRALIDAASQIARFAHSDETDTNTVIEKAEHAIYSVTRSDIRIETKMVSFAQLADAHYDRTEHIMRHGMAHGLKTGLIDLDRGLGGMQQGDVVLVAGRPGMAKSGFVQQVVMHNAENGIPCGVFPLEMSGQSWINRALTKELQMPYKQIEAGNFGEKFVDYTIALDRLKKLPIHVDESGYLTPDMLRSRLQRWVYDYGVKLVVIDYIQLMSGGAGFQRGDNRVQELSYITREVKKMAREYNVVIMEAGQLSRAVEQRRDKRALLSDLRESGSLEQDADIVMFPFRPKYYDKATIYGDRSEINVAKHRNGPTFKVDVMFLPEYFCFGNYAANAGDPPPLPPAEPDEREQQYELDIALDEYEDKHRIRSYNRKVYGQSD